MRPHKDTQTGTVAIPFSPFCPYLFFFLAILDRGCLDPILAFVYTPPVQDRSPRRGFLFGNLFPGDVASRHLLCFLHGRGPRTSARPVVLRSQLSSDSLARANVRLSFGSALPAPLPLFAFYSLLPLSPITSNLACVHTFSPYYIFIPSIICVSHRRSLALIDTIQPSRHRICARTTPSSCPCLFVYVGWAGLPRPGSSGEETLSPWVEQWRLSLRVFSSV